MKRLPPSAKRLAVKIKEINKPVKVLKLQAKRDSSFKKEVSSIITKKDPYDLIESLFRVLNNECTAYSSNKRAAQTLNFIIGSSSRKLVALSRNDRALTWLAVEQVCRLSFYLQYRANRQAVAACAQHKLQFPVLTPAVSQLSASREAYLKALRLGKFVPWILGTRTRRQRPDAEFIVETFSNCWPLPM